MIRSFFEEFEGMLLQNAYFEHKNEKYVSLLGVHAFILIRKALLRLFY